MITDLPIKSTFFFNNINFEVVKAKSKNQDWISKKIKKEVIKCRRAYLMYGHVPLLDKYDKKSTVYLIKVRSINPKISENFSIRFVQAKNQNPYATEDFFHLGKKNNAKFLENFLKNHLGYQKTDIKNHIATISKFCGISVPNQNNKKQKLLATKEAFCLGNYCYLKDEFESKSIFFITALFRDEVIKKSLLYKSPSNEILPKFTTASKMLNWKNPINRTFSAYQYPGYFLNLPSLLKQLQTMHKTNVLTKKTLVAYLGKNFYTKTFIKNTILPQEAKNFSHLLTTEGQLKFSYLSGEQLRKILNTKVKDGPNFYFLMRKNWEKSIQKLFNQLFK